MSAAQDPSEPFDLYDVEGRPLGRTKARAEVHRDGDWHRSMHLWVVSRARGAVLVQRRGRHKDTWPLCLDVAVAGHYRAGEGLAEVLREAEEEVGLVVGPGDVTRLGTRVRADDGARGIRDNELQDILAFVAEDTLPGLRAAPDELEGLLWLSLADAARLFSEPGASAEAEVYGGAGERVRVRAEDFVPCPDGYWLWALGRLGELTGA